MLDSVTPFNITDAAKKSFFQFFKSRYGIGKNMARVICNFSGIHPLLNIKRMLDYTFNSPFSNMYIVKKVRLFFIIHKYRIDNLLRSRVEASINTLSTIRTYRGRMHMSRLPVRGQRRRTNARTIKKMSMPSISSHGYESETIKAKAIARRPRVIKKVK